MNFTENSERVVSNVVYVVSNRTYRQEHVEPVEGGGYAPLREMTSRTSRTWREALAA